MDRQKKVPIRTCISCRESSEKRTLTRIVKTTGGEVRIDPAGKLPGRGAYLCARKDCLALAIKQKKLGRALRCEIPESVIAELQTILVKDDVE